MQNFILDDMGVYAENPIDSTRKVWEVKKKKRKGRLWDEHTEANCISIQGGNRGWDGWMALLTQWIRVWLNSRT